MSGTSGTMARPIVTDPAADERLRESIARARRAPFLRERLAAAGIDERGVTGIGDLPRLPMTTKEELREHGPWGWTAVPTTEVVRIHASSGTTGRRTVLTYTARDVECWTQLFARCYAYAGVGPDDRVQTALGYGLWTAGIGFQAAAERVGAMAIPTGRGDTALQLEMLTTYGATVLGATVSFAVVLGEAVSQAGIDTDLRAGLFGGERWGERQRAHIEHTLGITSYDLYGLSELWGPGMGVECDRRDGIHVWTDNYVVEIVDPTTLEPVPAGERGEIVVTTLTKEAMPLVRYRTRDLSRMLTDPCGCGSPFPRIARLSGRTDDTVTIGGMLVVPSEIDVMLAECSTGDATGEFQLHVDRDDRGRDAALCRVEGATDQPLGARLGDALRQAYGIRFDVEVVNPGTLPRSEHKTRRVFDHRDHS